MKPFSGVVGIVALALIAIMGIEVFRPVSDNLTVITQIIGFAMTVATSLLAYLKSQETHMIVNSRMDEFKAKLEEASLTQQSLARAAGVEEGRNAANQRTDAISDSHH